MSRRIYTKYQMALEKLGYRQLDIYRYKDRDVLRIADRSGRIYLVGLPTHRESMEVEDFVNYVKKEITRQKEEEKKKKKKEEKEEKEKK